MNIQITQQKLTIRHQHPPFSQLPNLFPKMMKMKFVYIILIQYNIKKTEEKNSLVHTTMYKMGSVNSTLEQDRVTLKSHVRSRNVI